MGNIRVMGNILVMGNISHRGDVSSVVDSRLRFVTENRPFVAVR